METGTGGGPEVQGDSTAVEESAKLWRYPPDLTRAINHPSWGSEEVGGAHIVATMDSEGMSRRPIRWSCGDLTDAGVIGAVVPLETYAH